jgi:uncharacterized protein
MIQSLAILLFVFFTSIASAYDFSVPALRDPVNDHAGMISNEVQTQINQALIQLHEAGGTQIAVLTVESLNGLSIEQASIQVVDKWQLGSKASDNGILLMVAKEERKIRIEVGQGAEGELTDSYSKRIIDESMTPLFRSGNISEGILVGVFQIAQVANPNIDVKPFFNLQNTWSSARRDKSKSGMSPIVFLLFFVFLIISGAGRGRRRGLLTGALLGSVLGGRSSGGFGRSSGGGGFRGGGGGFSGGGASGGW